MGAGASTNDPIDQEDKDERTDEHDRVWKKSNLRKRTVRHIQKMLEEKKRKNHSKRHFNKEKREVERKESEARLRKTNTKRINTHETETNITIVNENRRPIPPSSVENIEDDLLPPPSFSQRNSRVEIRSSLERGFWITSFVALDSGKQSRGRCVDADI